MPFRSRIRNWQASRDRELSCPQCGSGTVRTEKTEHRFTYGDGETAVELTARVPLRKCEQCGEEFLDDEAETLIHGSICRHLGVMTPEEVRRIREQAGGLSRSEFARLTRLGEATIGRWERGQLIQNAAYDQFLYLLRFPDNLIRLRERVERKTSVSSGNTGPIFRAIRPKEFASQADRFFLNTAGAA